MILGSLVAGGIAWIALRSRPFRVAVEGTSMAPSLLPGDFLVATRRGPLRHGSLVVVEHPGHPGYELVKRIEAVPTERIAGRLLGWDEYWLLGDNSVESTDSRTLGPMPAEAIRGVIRLRYWPASRFRLFG